MTITGCKIIYANHSLDEIGGLKVDIDSIDSESNDEESEVLLSTTPFRSTWMFHGVQKVAPLKFKLTICLENGKFIDANIERQLKKLLCKNTFNWLSIQQDDLGNVFYNCLIYNPQKINATRMTAGLQFSVICNSNNAWSDLKIKSYSSTITSTISFDFDSDYDNYDLLPTVIITSKANQNITLKNNTSNKIITINNCQANEIITMDSMNEIVESSVGRNIISDWNVSFLELQSGLNSLTLTGNFLLRLEYRLPIRIGG
jgi:hypothetical protein